MKKQTATDEKKIKVSTLIYGVLILVMIFLSVSSILAYGTRTEIGAKISSRIASFIPFPAAIINWRHVVYIDDVEANLASIENFYQAQDFAKEGLRIDFTTEDGKKRLRIKEREILDKLVENKIIEILAKQKGITISKEDVDNVVSQKLNEFGTEEAMKKDLLKSYGWSMDDFKQKIVLPGLYAEMLAKNVSLEITSNTKAKENITQAQKQLESGKEFVDVVRNYSQGPSKDKNGELGWVRKVQVLPELQVALFEKDNHKKNDIIESSIGFHIVEVENSKKENGEDVLQLRQIFVMKNTFADWLETEKKKMKVTILLSDFSWNGESGIVDFRDEKMNKFENQERAKTQGDASIMF